MRSPPPFFGSFPESEISVAGVSVDLSTRTPNSGSILTMLWLCCDNTCLAWQNIQLNVCRLYILSKPKLNQNLSSTEFEARLHSYSDIHHHHHPGTLCVVVVVNCPAISRQRLSVQLYSHCQCSHSVQIQLEMYRQVSTVFLWHRLSFCD